MKGGGGEGVRCVKNRGQGRGKKKKNTQGLQTESKTGVMDWSAQSASNS